MQDTTLSIDEADDLSPRARSLEVMRTIERTLRSSRTEDAAWDTKLSKFILAFDARISRLSDDVVVGLIFSHVAVILILAVIASHVAHHW